MSTVVMTSASGVCSACRTCVIAARAIRTAQHTAGTGTSTGSTSTVAGSRPQLELPDKIGFRRATSYDVGVRAGNIHLTLHATDDPVKMDAHVDYRLDPVLACAIVRRARLARRWWPLPGHGGGSAFKRPMPSDME